MKQPLVSVIVPTKNSAQFLEACLQSIKDQTYQNIELIVVDNFSTDATPKIAKQFTKKFHSQGPERSAQRNFGVKKASGDVVVIIDSDMQLTKDVVGECMAVFTEDDTVGSVIIPEESFGEGFWAQCKKLERSFYVGVDWMEAARAFRKELYLKLGGYNVSMISGEDWDLSQRAAKVGKLVRINSHIMHNEGRLKFSTTIKKKYYYAQKITKYLSSNKEDNSVRSQTGLFSRYKLYLGHPVKLFKNPILGVGMLFMKTSEFAFGALGLLLYKVKAGGRAHAGN